MHSVLEISLDNKVKESFNYMLILTLKKKNKDKLC